MNFTLKSQLRQAFSYVKVTIWNWESVFAQSSKLVPKHENWSLFLVGCFSMQQPLPSPHNELSRVSSNMWYVDLVWSVDLQKRCQNLHAEERIGVLDFNKQYFTDSYTFFDEFPHSKGLGRSNGWKLPVRLQERKPRSISSKAPFWRRFLLLEPSQTLKLWWNWHFTVKEW